MHPAFRFVRSPLVLALCLACASLAHAETPAEAVSTPAEAPAATAAPAPAHTGWTLGGVLRGRWDVRFNDAHGDGTRRTSNHLSFDTLILKADYDGKDYFASAQYRFYGGSVLYSHAGGYRNYPGEVSFPLQAYAGRRFANGDRVAVGLQPVVLDEQYWGAQVLGSIGFVVGLEEVYAPGITYRHDGDGYRLAAGYYPTSTPDGKGISRDGARYSTAFVQGDSYVPNGTRTSERDLVAATLDRDLYRHDDITVSAAVSGLYSRLQDKSGTPQGDGERRALAASIKVGNGSWRGKVLVARQDISLPAARDTHVITVGGFDASYNIATKGTVVFAEVGRPVTLGGQDVDLYASLSRFIKDEADFKDSQRLTLGSAWTHGRLRVSSELLVGRNDPFVGAGQYISGAAEGGDDRYKTSLFTVIGYRF